MRIELRRDRSQEQNRELTVNGEVFFEAEVKVRQLAAARE
jgi:hypothetical protein